MLSTVDRTELDRLVSGAHHNPHAVLGAHPRPDGSTVIRTLRPEAATASVVAGRTRTPMQRVHDGGVFEAVIDGPPSDYRIEVSYGDETHRVDDPYRWLPTLGEVDLHLIGEGR
ncbi:MAG: 1,4-alpha-glucan branching enzyme, partial [Pseudonocardiales bacterium]|nr:1,4-alpha-glucan branching enzyme [Pseudonocardiales bacterium]